jgi:uncharacterized protein YqkB
LEKKKQEYKKFNDDLIRSNNDEIATSKEFEELFFEETITNEHNDSNKKVIDLKCENETYE